MFKATTLQIVLAREVSIIGRPADVGAIANILDRDLFVTFLNDQGEQCLMQHLSASRHATIDWRLRHLIPHFPVELRFLFGTGHPTRKRPAKAFRTRRLLSYIMYGFAMRALKLRLHPVSERKVGPRPERRPLDATPRWVKISCAVALVVIAIIVGLHLAGEGMGHLSHGDTDTHAAPAEPSGHPQ